MCLFVFEMAEGYQFLLEVLPPPPPATPTTGLKCCPATTTTAISDNSEVVLNDEHYCSAVRFVAFHRCSLPTFTAERPTGTSCQPYRGPSPAPPFSYRSAFYEIYET